MTKKILYLIAQEGFRDEEFTVPKGLFEAAGWRVHVAAEDRKPCAGAVNVRVFPDITFREAKIGDYAAVVAAGGGGAVRYLWNNPIVLKLMRDAHAAGRVVGGICLSGALPAQAGLLNGRNGTVWPEPKALEELKRHGVQYVPDRVVVSGRVVTAPGPQSSNQFGEAILELLGSSLHK